MYCIYCKTESKGTFCTTCGHKNVSSEKEWLHWEGIFSAYSKKKLEEIVSHPDEYKDDALATAMYLNDNFVEEVEEETSLEVAEEKMWYYSCDGERKGPISTTEVIGMYERGFMRDTSAIWKSGFADWVRLDQAGIVLPKIKNSAPPPVEVQNMNNGAIVVLLFVPILSTFLQFLIAGWLYVDVSKLWWFSYGLNTLCCAIDYYRVKKAGYNTGKLMVAFLFLIPLYIYSRMKLVNGRKWLATIIWSAVFVANLMIPSVFWVKLIGASNPAMISSVQEGNFYDFPDVNVGQLFERTIEDCEWDTYMGANSRVIVSMDGLLDGYKIEVIFDMQMDDSFEISSVWFGGEYCTKREMSDIMNYIFARYE